MWSRKELKERAKAVLRGNYWTALGVSIVIALVGGNNGRSSGGGGSNRAASRNSRGAMYSSDLSDIIFSEWMFIIGIVIGFILLIAVLRIFLGYCLEVGGRKYFVQSAQYKDNKNCFSFGFAGQNYIGIILTMLLRSVQNFLWFLLLIIPGIVKAYAYRMVPYILADNPNIGAKKAIELSNQMTDGHKLDMFVLDLSFIGWYLLGMLAFGLGILFVLPYENATNAELYLVLRKNALESNLCSLEDLLLDNVVTDL
jgi:F0F1-type ATP synthase membrane subunit c/vacuolar-type H+-ATPase subunit K